MYIQKKGIILNTATESMFYLDEFPPSIQSEAVSVLMVVFKSVTLLSLATSRTSIVLLWQPWRNISHWWVLGYWTKNYTYKYEIFLRFSYLGNFKGLYFGYPIYIIHLLVVSITPISFYLANIFIQFVIFWMCFNFRIIL